MTNACSPRRSAVVSPSRRWPAAIVGFALILLAVLLPAAPAQAHKASDAYLQLRETPAGIELRWDIALRDLDTVVDIDADGDGRITWGEVKAAWPAIEQLALGRLQIDGCDLKPVGRGLERRSDGAYAVLQLRSGCHLDAAATPAVHYSLMRETDPTHRGLLKLERTGQPVQLIVLDPQGRSSVAAAGAGPGADTGPAAAPSAPPSFVQEGIRHIVTGYDHVLFLLCLLLPSVTRRTPQGWRPVERISAALWPVLGIVTTFTVAHSITLTLAALKLASLPPSFIEPAIAVTIILAAVDNLFPLFRGRRGLVTFLFGLIHGFGFAGVLAELDLPTSAFASALLQFNVGLELGQLLIVLVAVSLLYAARRAQAYPRWAIGGGSVVAIVVGALWFVERTAGVSLLPI